MIKEFDIKFNKHFSLTPNNNVGGKDLNDIKAPGAYGGLNCTNAPDSNYIELFVTKHTDDWIVQECKTIDLVIFLRACRNEIWGPWKELDNVECNTSHTHPNATTVTSGFMSYEDKIKMGTLTPFPNSINANIIAINDNREFATKVEKKQWHAKSEFDGKYDSLIGKPDTYSAVWVGDEPPENTRSLWVNFDDEDDDAVVTGNILTEIRSQLSEFGLTVADLTHALKKEMDSGYFGNKEPAFDGPVEKDPLYTYNDNPYAGTIGAMVIRRGNKEDLMKEVIMEGQFAFCLDTEELYIGNKGTVRLIAKVGGAGGSGGGNVTGEYIMLETPDRQYFRISLDNSGGVHIIHGDAYFEKAPDVSESSRFKGLLINHVFGGGTKKVNKSIVSHSFIELYNNTDLRINLKGLSLQVADNMEPWQTLELVGLVQPRSSFLIRCSELTNIDTQNPRLIIDKFDMDWGIEISDMGYKTYLTVGIEPSSYPNPSNINGNGALAPGYIDLLGVGGDSVGQPVDGYEKAYLNVANRNTSVHRIDFRDKEDNKLDCEALDWNQVDTDIYRPRCSADGKWDVHYDKVKQSPYRPMIVNMGFAKKGDTDRTFSWQSFSSIGYVKWRKVGERKFKQQESAILTIRHGDGDVIRHSVIVRNFTPGIYEYMVGDEGRWSDLYEFEVKVPKNTDPIRFIQITDQQAVIEYDYQVWKHANSFITDNEHYDFIINSGDISDSANKVYEWRYYYEYSKYNISNYPHMSTCGNNDLVNKKYPDAFNYYSTVEDPFMPSVYSWNYGYIHFVVVNSNVAVKTDAGELQPTPIEPQLEWLEEDLNKPENKKRWTIVIIHEAPYTIIRNSKLEKFHTVFAKHKVDLVMCGHHHMYSRSHGMGPFNADKSDNVLSRAALYKTGDGIVIDPERRVMTNGGVVYIMCQATGSKLQGKTTPEVDNLAHWRGNYFRDFDPSYVMYNITYDEIQMNAFKINNLFPLIDMDLIKHPLVKEERDSITIRKKV